MDNGSGNHMKPVFQGLLKTSNRDTDRITPRQDSGRLGRCSNATVPQ